VSSFATEARALERARPLPSRVRAFARRAALGALSSRPRRSGRGVRIVHYHYVFDDERERFAEQLRFLAREFRPASLSQAVERLRLGQAAGDELVVTFDDGFRNQLDNAAPLLAEHGFSACFFLVSDLLDADREQAHAFCRDKLHLPLPVEPLDWDGAARLLELGHEVGSHTRSHPNLTSLEPEALLDELTSSRELLSKRLGAVRHVSAPYGDRLRFSETVADAARTAGYESCASAIRGVNRSALELYTLHRHHLSASWPIRELRYFLA
jgi:peptidoglycan/xylan/chitin deacetylase (PgdA/CDA1 family)